VAIKQERIEDLRADLQQVGNEHAMSEEACRQAERRHQESKQQIVGLEGALSSKQHELADIKKQQGAAMSEISCLKKSMAGIPHHRRTTGKHAINGNDSFSVSLLDHVRYTRRLRHWRLS
jgi:chromosome segregation ATPase